MSVNNTSPHTYFQGGQCIGSAAPVLASQGRSWSLLCTATPPDSVFDLYAITFS